MDFEEEKKPLSSISKAFNLHTVDLVALSWLNWKTHKGKSLYLAPWGLIFDANIDLKYAMFVFIA